MIVRRSPILVEYESRFDGMSIIDIRSYKFYIEWNDHDECEVVLQQYVGTHRWSGWRLEKGSYQPLTPKDIQDCMDLIGETKKVLQVYQNGSMLIC